MTNHRYRVSDPGKIKIIVHMDNCVRNSYRKQVICGNTVDGMLSGLIKNTAVAVCRKEKREPTFVVFK
jgi:hypothetical protein